MERYYIKVIIENSNNEYFYSEKANALTIFKNLASEYPIELIYKKLEMVKSLYNFLTVEPVKVK